MPLLVETIGKVGVEFDQTLLTGQWYLIYLYALLNPVQSGSHDVTESDVSVCVLYK